MAWFVGATLALVVSLFAKVVGLDRDRAFYPTVLAVVASYYDLFAVMAGSTPALLRELAVTGVFLAAVVIGFRRSPWIVAGALAAHGLFDLAHGRVIANPGVPPFWPAFCSSYDMVAALWLAGRLRRRGASAQTSTVPSR